MIWAFSRALSLQEGWESLNRRIFTEDLQVRREKRMQANPPKFFKELYATKQQLNQVCDELKSGIASVNLSIKSLEQKMDTRFTEVESRFTGIDARFEEAKATSHRMLALMEEMRAENRYVLDGYAQVYEGQKALEERVTRLEEKSV